MELAGTSESCLVYLYMIFTILQLKLKQIHLEWFALDSPEYLCLCISIIWQLIFLRVSFIQRWSINEAGGGVLAEKLCILKDLKLLLASTA